MNLRQLVQDLLLLVRRGGACIALDCLEERVLEVALLGKKRGGELTHRREIYQEQQRKSKILQHERKRERGVDPEVRHVPSTHQHLY